MKGRLFLAFAFFVVAAIVFYIGAKFSKGDTPFSNGEILGDERIDSLSLVGVNQLVSEGMCQVQLHASDREIMIASYDGAKAINYSKVEDERLTINFDVEKSGFLEFKTYASVKIDIYTRSIDSLVNRGTGSITSSDTFMLDKLYLQNEGVGSVAYTTRADQVVAINRGLGSMDIFGNTRVLLATNEGVGSLNTQGLSSKKVKARNRGIGSMEIYGSDSLSLSNDGIGSLRYKGQGIVYKLRNNGIGSISKD